MSPKAIPGDDSSRWWKTVLGEYPTGISLITARTADGADVAMVVGTFSAVSQDPPLISFLPSVNSASFEQIRQAGSFSVSVLGAAHEQLCRSFARKDPDRFSGAQWQRSASGALRLSDAVVWFDATISAVTPAGDHEFVLGAVNDFGVGDGDGGLPLLFLRGGYGTFNIPSLRFDLEGVAWQLRAADALRIEIDRFAAETGFECVLTGLAGDSVVVLHATNIQPRGQGALARRPVGAAFPFAAPLGAVFAAWGSEVTQHSWVEQSRHLLGEVDRPAIAELLETTRQRGFSTTSGHESFATFEEYFENGDTSPSVVSGLWSRIAATGAIGRMPADSDATLQEINSLQLPVFDTHGHAALVVTVRGFGADMSSEIFDSVVQRAQLLATHLTQLAIESGVLPSSAAHE